MNCISKRFRYGEFEVCLETGRIARQASGAVLASMGDTSVLVTVVASREPSDRDFLPLTVDYEEKNLFRRSHPRRFFLSARDDRPKKRF